MIIAQLSPGELWWSHSCSQWATKTRPINDSKGWASCHWSFQKNFIDFSRGWMRGLGTLLSCSAETCNEKGSRDALADRTWALLSHSRHGSVYPREKNLRTEFLFARDYSRNRFWDFLKSFPSSTVSISCSNSLTIQKGKESHVINSTECSGPH